MMELSSILLQIRLSEGLKKQIAVQAFQNEQTLRAFVLSALKQYGVPVDDCDLIDRRKVRNGDRSDA
jgi:hypothetical protein